VRNERKGDLTKAEHQLAQAKTKSVEVIILSRRRKRYYGIVGESVCRARRGVEAAYGRVRLRRKYQGSLGHAMPLVETLPDLTRFSNLEGGLFQETRKAEKKN
jgi:hypothetical protein